MFEFLQSAPLAIRGVNGLDSVSSLLGPLVGLAIGVIILMLLVLIIIYIYLSLAFMSIGRKAGLSDNASGLAWVPFFGPVLVSYLVSDMHWWTWILVITFFIPFVDFVTGLIFFIFMVIWGWKMFTSVGKPGWWSLVPLIGWIFVIVFLIAKIPALGLIIDLICVILYLVFIGVAAWSGGVKSPEKYI
jgi:hypothetical protein